MVIRSGSQKQISAVFWVAILTAQNFENCKKWLHLEYTITVNNVNLMSYSF